MRKHFMSQNRILHVQKILVVLPLNDYAMHIRSIYSQTQNFVMKIKQRTLNTNFLVNPFKRIYVIDIKICHCGIARKTHQRRYFTMIHNKYNFAEFSFAI